MEVANAMMVDKIALAWSLSCLSTQPKSLFIRARQRNGWARHWPSNPPKFDSPQSEFLGVSPGSCPLIKFRRCLIFHPQATGEDDGPVVPEALLQKSLRTCWVLVVGLVRGIAGVRVVVCVAVLLIILQLVSPVEANKNQEFVSPEQTSKVCT